MERINCLKCYRIHKCGTGKYYCPFFALQPCIRGYHTKHQEELFDPNDPNVCVDYTWSGTSIPRYLEKLGGTT